MNGQGDQKSGHCCGSVVIKRTLRGTESHKGYNSFCGNTMLQQSERCSSAQCKAPDHKLKHQ